MWRERAVSEDGMRYLALCAMLLPAVSADSFCNLSWSGVYCAERSPIVTVLIWVGIVLLIVAAGAAVSCCCCCCCGTCCQSSPPPPTVVTTMMPYQVPVGGMANQGYQPVATQLPPTQCGPYPGPYPPTYPQANPAYPQPPPYQTQDTHTPTGKTMANPQLYPSNNPDNTCM